MNELDIPRAGEGQDRSPTSGAASCRIGLGLGLALGFLVVLDPPAGSAAREAQPLLPGAASSYGFVRPGAASEGAPRAAAYASLNPAHALRAYFGGEGVRILPGLAGEPGWSLDLRAVLLDPAGAESALEGSSFQAGGTRIDYVLSEPLGIKAWGANGKRGMALGFAIDASVAAASGERAPAHRIGFTFQGDLAAKLSETSGALALYAPAGDPVLLVEGVRVVDASGAAIPANLEMLPGAESYAQGFRVALDRVEPAYPVEMSFRLSSPAAGKGVASGSHDSQLAGSESLGGGGAEALTAPGNDACDGAEILPGGGPFPHLTAVTADVTDATTAGDPPLPSCQPNVSRSIWYQFTPSVTASYTISSCTGATGTTATDTVIAVYTSSGACGGSFTQVPGSCDDDSCGATEFNAVSTVTLEAGTTYYIVVWQFGAAPPAAGEEAVQLRVTQRFLAPPPNDQCAGAEAIPDSGPFSYTTSLTSTILDATSTNDPPPPSCQPNVSRGIWYRFTPSVRANYTLATCADGPTGSTVNDTVLSVYTSTGGCAGTFTQVAGYCDDDSCALEDQQSVLSRPLEAGETYYILVSQFGTAPPAEADAAIQLRVSQDLSPGNDACGAATPLLLNAPVSGTTIKALDDYQLSDPGCFAGVSQAPSTAAGRDVAYAFTAAEADLYSFRVTNYSASLNLVLHVAGGCETGTPPISVGSCLGASNRATSVVQGTSNSSEEVMCQPLAAGETVYALVDENAVTGGSPFKVEVTRCEEESAPNDSPAQAGALRCGLEGAISPAGEADFFSLGSSAPGDRAFAMVDGVAANSNDFDLRVTTTTDTLEYDDQSNDAPFGTLAPDLAGTPLPGGAAYLKVNHFSSLKVSEPYRLYAAVQPSSATATPEVEPNGTLAEANAGPNHYFSGELSPPNDQDWFAFAAEAGDLVSLGLDADPLRNNTPINAALALFDPVGLSLLSVNDTDSSSSTTSGAGSLTVKTPRSPAEGLLYRVTVSGTHHARVTGSSAGDYLLSITRNCKIFPPADLALAQAAGPDPVPDSPLTYTLIVSNYGPEGARNVVLTDAIPPAVLLESALPSQGSCAGTGELTCSLGSIASGAQTTVAVTVIPSSVGSSIHPASVTSDNFDPNTADNTVLCGCEVPDVDTDGDGTADCDELCDEDPFKLIPGACGCGVPDTDSDGDGSADCVDGCPLDPVKAAPGVCGCGQPEVPGCGLPACGDGLDNDGDGSIDTTDPGCSGSGDTSEFSTLACDDGMDNDGDGFTDFDPDPGEGDPQCVGPTDNREQPKRRCGLGFELMGVFAALAWLDRRLRARSG